MRPGYPASQYLDTPPDPAGYLGNPALRKVLNRLIFMTFAVETDASGTQIPRATTPEAKRFT
jgi:hypothetical protein